MVIVALPSTIVAAVIIAISVVIVSSMIVLEAKPVSGIQTEVDVEDSLNHTHACLTTEVSSIDLVDFMFFNKLWWQNSVFKKHSLMFFIVRMDVAYLSNLVTVSDNLILIVVGLSHDFVSNVPQSLHSIAVTLNQIFGSKSQSQFTTANLFFLSLGLVHFSDHLICFRPLLDE